MSASPGPVTRRQLLRGAAAVGAGSVGGFLLGGARSGESSEPAASPDAPAHDAVESFFGPQQPGIISDPPRHTILASFDALDSSTDRAGATVDLTANLQGLLEEITSTGELLMAGSRPEPRDPDEARDSGIAVGLPPARLSLTVGLGPDLFRRQPRLARPKWLEPLPSFSRDRLRDEWSGGDLLLQLCGDDAQVLSAAFVELRSLMPGRATLRWTQHGFLSTPPGGGTPRNLLGQLDGTANPPRESDERFQTVVARDGEPSWFQGGSYMVFRKIRMKLADWSLTPLDEQHATIGRHRETGAPLSGGDERSAVDLDAVDAEGASLIAADAHVRRASGGSMFRRSYNYDYGLGPSPGDHHAEDHSHAGHEDEHGDHHGPGHDAFDAGALFIALVADPRQFVSVQERLDASDRLNAFIEHTGSAIFALPPGAATGSYLAAGLFDRSNPKE